ncbi:MAG: GDP-mannose 4,6-dehydratase [Bacteroidia bacterium]|nr:GDP-mannose 4,6-dehydratase [Bacteroidia bacterium]
MSTTILITGGAGFIGSSLAEHLAQNDDFKIVIIDNFMTGNLAKVPQSAHNNIQFVEADVNNYDALLSIFNKHNFGSGFDYVFHYAALVGVKRTLDNPTMVLEDITGIKNILILSKDNNVKRVFYSSSSEVYGEPVAFPQNEETTPLNSRLPYAIVKNVGEAFVRSYYQEYNLSYTIFRFFNTYGYKQSKDFVVSKYLSAALNNEDLIVYGDGLQTRTFCFIDDNIAACTTAFLQNKFINDTINVGGENEITILELAQTIIDVTQSKSKIVHAPALKEGDMTRRCPDISKMKTLLAKDLLPLHQGLQQLLTNTSYII